jgi:hypothetical protein
MEGFLSRDGAARTSVLDVDLRQWLESLPAATRSDLVRRSTCDLAQHSASGAVGVTVLLAMVLWSTTVLRDYPVTAIALAAGVIAGCGLRLVSAYALHRNDCGDEVRWWGRLLTVGIYLTSITWSVFAVLTVLLYPEEWPMWLLVFSSSGIAAGAASAFASHLLLARAYVSILLLPTAILAISMFGDLWVTLGVIILTYYAYLLIQMQTHSARYWKGARDGITISELNSRLQEEANLFKTAIERSATPAALVAADARLAFVNDALCMELGYTREELLAADIQDLAPRFTPEVWPEAWARLKRRRWIQYETDHRHKEGRLIRVLTTSSLVEFRGEEYNFAFFTDITALREAETERREVQEQLLQSQKMEAIGRLAGGIAHDFNNLLTVILGYASRQLSRLSEDDPLRASTEKINQAATRATEIVRQLLRISRQDVVTVSPLGLNTIVTDLGDLLGRIIGADIELATNLDPKLATVMADRGHIEQVLLNLVVNAREAMPDGGVVMISTANVEPDDPTATGTSTVRLSVADTGVGMSDEVRAHLFEPFYTTKGVHGTGLGLAIVNGIVSQIGGRIEVASRLTQGTVVDITMPASDRVAVERVDDSPVSSVAERVAGSTVLVVDDDCAVLELVREHLEAVGYTVISAADAVSAERQVEQSLGVDMLLTDVVMPDMSGPDLARRLTTRWPDMRVLYMSGYAPDHLLHRGVATERVSFIQKPFTPEQLYLAIQEGLGQEQALTGR